MLSAANLRFRLRTTKRLDIDECPGPL